MAGKDQIRYDLLVQDALKGVVRKVLSDAARDGLVGDHHFYIAFRTDHPGARLSDRLREKYPQEMTIVLQHQFWDLTVQDDLVAVTLKFHGRPSRLVIPLTAISAFGDPSVNFGLQLKTLSVEAESEDGEAGEPAKQEPASGQVIALDTFRKK